MTPHERQLDFDDLAAAIPSSDNASDEGIESLDCLAQWQSEIEEFASTFHTEVNEILGRLDDWKQAADVDPPTMQPAASTDPMPIDVPAVASQETMNETPPAPPSDPDVDRLAALKARISQQMNSSGHFAREDAPVTTSAAPIEAKSI